MEDTVKSPPDAILQSCPDDLNIESVQTGRDAPHFCDEHNADLDINAAYDTSTEKITENVEDIVQDLESLLDAPISSFSHSISNSNSLNTPIEDIHKTIESDIECQSSEIANVDNPTSEMETNVDKMNFTASPKDDLVSHLYEPDTHLIHVHNNNYKSTPSIITEIVPTTELIQNDNSDVPNSLQTNDHVDDKTCISTVEVPEDENMDIIEVINDKNDEAKTTTLDNEHYSHDLSTNSMIIATENVTKEDPNSSSSNNKFVEEGSTEEKLHGERTSDINQVSDLEINSTTIEEHATVLKVDDVVATPNTEYSSIVTDESDPLQDEKSDLHLTKCVQLDENTKELVEDVVEVCEKQNEDVNLQNTHHEEISNTDCVHKSSSECVVETSDDNKVNNTSTKDEKIEEKTKIINSDTIEEYENVSNSCDKNSINEVDEIKLENSSKSKNEVVIEDTAQSNSETLEKISFKENKSSTKIYDLSDPLVRKMLEIEKRKCSHFNTESVPNTKLDVTTTVIDLSDPEMRKALNLERQKYVSPTKVQDSFYYPLSNKEKNYETNSLDIYATNKSMQSSTYDEPLRINVDVVEKDRQYSPKIRIKPIKNPDQEEHVSLKMTITKQSDNTHSILKVFNPEETEDNFNGIEQVSSSSCSPRITFKPLVKPSTSEENERARSPLKITIKPLKLEEKLLRHSPKLIIKPIPKPSVDEDQQQSQKIHHSPRLTIKPILKSNENSADDIICSNTRLTIKPITRPIGGEGCSHSPRITIKPLIKPYFEETSIIPLPYDVIDLTASKSTVNEECDEERERIVLKINKGSLPLQTKKRPYSDIDPFDKGEKLAKLKLKLSKDGHPHVIPHDILNTIKSNRELEVIPTGGNSTLKGILNHNEEAQNAMSNVSILEEFVMNKTSPIVISEDSNQSSCILIDDKDGNEESMNKLLSTEEPMKRKRGRPRKVPLEQQQQQKQQRSAKIHEEGDSNETSRPKRMCRSQSVRTTLGIKPRKPRGRGGKQRHLGTREILKPVHDQLTNAINKPPSNEELTITPIIIDNNQSAFGVINTNISSNKLQVKKTSRSEQEGVEAANIVMYEEETRMSAAETPVPSTTETIDDISQSSATTESAKERSRSKKPQQEPLDGAVIAADQLAEYYWGGGGPYMLQEQVAQFLGINSFKRKYPNIPRRMVDMQERDFIRESGLAGEAMCDLGLTAVNSSDILDLMYMDFQEKYEEYCRHQRERQAKDLANKQKALSLAASQEKTKLDIMQQAIHSSALWNAKFNKTRQEQRKACLDLQTLTIHFPKGHLKDVQQGIEKVGNYPVALVPGQYTDYYKTFHPNELYNLPLNTMCSGSLACIDDSSSDSESGSSLSDSDSSCSYSSDEDCCSVCKLNAGKNQVGKQQVKIQ